MATGVLKKPARIYGPDSNGIVMTPRQFDRAEFAEGYRYELINGVLVVSPIPSESEAEIRCEKKDRRIPAGTLRL